MTTATPRPIGITTPAQRQWFIVGRWQEFEGESRANLLRIIAIGAFYIVQLAHFYAFSNRDAVQTDFHQKATAIAVAWTMVALAVMLCLRQRIFPAALKFFSTGCDLLLLTALASLGAGPRSPIVVALFLIIALAALRFSLSLVWFSTLGAMLCYWLLVGIADAKTGRWFDADHAVPPVEQLIWLLGLAMTGIVVGQVVRRVQRVAEEYAARIAAAPGKNA